KLVVIRGRARQSMFSGFHASRENEVLELAVDVTEGTYMPAQSVIAESVGRNPPPLGGGFLSAHRLVANLDGMALPYGLEDIAKDVGLHAPVWNGQGIMLGRRCKPEFGHTRPSSVSLAQMSEVRGCIGLHENRLEIVRRF